MFAREDGFLVLVENFHQLAHHAEAGLFVFALFLDGHAHADGVADEHRLDEPQPVVAVRKRLGINHPRCHADGHAEDERAVRDALFKILGFAPFRVHVVRIKITGLTGVQHDVRFRNGAAHGFTGSADDVVFEKLGLDHAELRVAFKGRAVKAVEFAGGFGGCGLTGNAIVRHRGAGILERHIAGKLRAQQGFIQGWQSVAEKIQTRGIDRMVQPRGAMTGLAASLEINSLLHFRRCDEVGEVHGYARVFGMR